MFVLCVCVCVCVCDDDDDVSKMSVQCWEPTPYPAAGFLSFAERRHLTVNKMC